MKYVEIDKKCPKVTFQGLHPSNIDYWKEFLKTTSERLDIGSSTGVIFALRIFFQKVCGYGPDDKIEITKYRDEPCGPLFTCQINGNTCGTLKVESTVKSDKRRVNQFSWQTSYGDLQKYEVLAKEKSLTIDKDKPNDIYNSDVVLTFRPLTIEKVHGNSIVSFTTSYTDNRGYRTEIYMKPLGTKSSISIDYHHGDTVPQLTIDKDAPYILENYESLSKYLLGLEELNLEKIYNSICSISFGTALNQIEGLKLYIYRAIIADSLITGKFPFECCADEIWVSKGNIERFSLDGTSIYTGGRVDTYYGSERLHNINNDYYDPNMLWENSYVDAIRKTATKAVQMFPKETITLFGLETGQEKSLLGDVWRENSLAGQLHLFAMMNDFPIESTQNDYNGSSTQNTTAFEQTTFFTEHPKQYQKQADFKQ